MVNQLVVVVEELSGQEVGQSSDDNDRVGHCGVGQSFTQQDCVSGLGKGSCLDLRIRLMFLYQRQKTVDIGITVDVMRHADVGSAGKMTLN